MYIKCPECRESVNGEDPFCSECGTKLNIASPAEETTDKIADDSNVEFSYTAPVQPEVSDELSENIAVDAPNSVFSIDSVTDGVSLNTDELNRVADGVSSHVTDGVTDGVSLNTVKVDATNSVVSVDCVTDGVSSNTADCVADGVSSNTGLVSSEENSVTANDHFASDCTDFRLRWNQGASMFLAGTGTSLEFEIIPQQHGEMCSDFRLFLKSPGDKYYAKHTLQYVSITRPVPVSLNFRPTSEHVGVNQSLELLFAYTLNDEQVYFSNQFQVDVYPAEASADKIIENVNIKIDSITQEGKAGESQLNILNDLTHNPLSSLELLRQIKESGTLWINVALIRSKPLASHQISTTVDVSSSNIFSVKRIAFATILISLILFGLILMVEQQGNTILKSDITGKDISGAVVLPLSSVANSKAVAIDQSLTLPGTSNLVPHQNAPVRHSSTQSQAKVSVVDIVENDLSSSLEVRKPKQVYKSSPQIMSPKQTKVISTLYSRPDVVARLDLLVKNIPHDFSLSIKPSKNRTNFVEGEKISFNVLSEKNCYITVFVVQADDSVVVLYPNKFTELNLISSGKRLKIPSADNENVFIEVSPPFGVDIIQVIACTTRSGLHRFINEMQPNAGIFKVLTRGLLLSACTKRHNTL